MPDSKKPSLSVTMIDVGWGDSLLIESVNAQGKSFYALVDSNDDSESLSSYIFLRRFFERRGVSFTKSGAKGSTPLFDFVALSHAHADHGQGLGKIMLSMGTKRFLYSKTDEWSALTALLRLGRKADSVKHEESLHPGKEPFKLGDAEIEILWPPTDFRDEKNPNNNSAVMLLTLKKVSFVLSGDAETKVWKQIADKIPAHTRFFKVPHHGSSDSTARPGVKGNWLDKCPSAVLGISCHCKPIKNLPSPKVLDLFDKNHRNYYRTDLNYHLTFATDGEKVWVKSSQEEEV